MADQPMPALPGAADLGKLRDAFEIQAVKTRYCEFADILPIDPPAAAEKLRTVFAADVIADYGHGVLQGREAVLRFLVDQVGGSTSWTWHAIHTPFIMPDGDTAEARWTLVAMVRPRATGVVETAIGRYLDRFTRTEDGWRISDIRWVQEHRA